MANSVSIIANRLWGWRDAGPGPWSGYGPGAGQRAGVEGGVLGVLEAVMWRRAWWSGGSGRGRIRLWCALGRGLWWRVVRGLDRNLVVGLAAGYDYRLRDAGHRARG